MGGGTRRIRMRRSLRQLDRRTARHRGVALHMQRDRMWGVQLAAPVGKQLRMVPPVWYGACARMLGRQLGPLGPAKNAEVTLMRPIHGNL